MRNQNIKQHYVPQFYLRNFADKNGNINVFDINRENHYKTSPRNECYEKLLYDLNPEILNRFSDNTNHYEEIVDDKIRILNEEVSSILINSLNKAISTGKGFEFISSDREILYDFIVLQTFRTPFYRKRLNYLCFSFALRTEIDFLDEKELLDLIHNLLLFGVVERLYNLDFKLNETYHLFFDHLIDEILSLKLQLRDSQKLFLLNKSTEKFITSNTPVNIRWKPDFLAHLKMLVTTMDKEKPILDIGNYLEFMTIHLPMSREFSIFIFNKNVDNNLNEMNQSVGIIRDYNSDLAFNLNYSTFLKSSDKVFSSTDNFDKFIEWKNNRINPFLKFEFRELNI
ncbi:DUF4238 domain-containing protein [Nonlabens ulvanivorans]|uniref:DUF4238 domain-containing protein n=1 Tax=Nonlabens ulvanivorans TaxID=906888 RepID=UPI0037C87834